MPNGCAFDVAPEEESLTVIVAVPGVAIREPEMEAVRMASVLNVVGIGLPFH
jgi:hypothetical protein